MGFLFENFSVLQLVFIALSCGGAWMAGRACAVTWRPYVSVVVYIAILSAGVRFILFALFGGTLLSLHYWITDFVLLLAVGSIAYRYTLANQMASQYYWLYAKSGLLSWKAK